jgi:hypothetical protein
VTRSAHDEEHAGHEPDEQQPRGRVVVAEGARDRELDAVEAVFGPDAAGQRPDEAHEQPQRQRRPARGEGRQDPLGPAVRTDGPDHGNSTASASA